MYNNYISIIPSSVKTGQQLYNLKKYNKRPLTRTSMPITSLGAAGAAKKRRSARSEQPRCLRGLGEYTDREA